LKPPGHPPPAPTRAYVGIGANLADPAATVVAAIERLRPWGLVAASGLYRSAPVDAGGPDYINAVAALDTELEPLALLDVLQAIEAEFGRTRPYHHAPRTLDLDLLLYGDEIIVTPALTVPHPRMHHRAFVLAPLAELRPGAVIPGRGRVDQLLGAVAGQQIERLLDG